MSCPPSTTGSGQLPTDLGTAATKNVGTTSNDVAAGDAPSQALNDAKTYVDQEIQALNLGTAATKNVGTTINDVAAGDTLAQALLNAETMIFDALNGLNLGNAANKNVGTTINDVAAGDAPATALQDAKQYADQTFIPQTEAGQSIATLVNGVLPTNQLPPGTALSTPAVGQNFLAQTTVANQVAALGLILPSNAHAAFATTGTLVAAHNSKTILLTSSSNYTLEIDVASNLGANWWCRLYNAQIDGGGGTITLDAYGSETIDGALTRTIHVGEEVILICDGSNFTSISVGIYNQRMLQKNGTIMWPDHGSNSTILNNSGVSPNIWYAMPYKIAYDADITSLSTPISTGVTGGKLRMALMTVASNGLPGSVIVQTDELSAATGGTTGSIATTRISAGWIYTALITDSTLSIRQAIPPRANPLADTAGGSYDVFATCVTANYTYGVFPSTYPGSFSISRNNQTTGPLIVLRG